MNITIPMNKGIQKIDSIQGSEEWEETSDAELSTSFRRIQKIDSIQGSEEWEEASDAELSTSFITEDRDVISILENSTDL